MSDRYRTFEILLVEDNPGYIRLMMEALKESNVNNALSVVRDGVEALDFLHKIGKYAQAPRPDLILLDLKLPKRNGQEILAEIKNDPNLKRIPVVVLTVSSAEQDILKSYNLHANCYIIKPADLDKFIEVVKVTLNFWFNIVSLPPGE